MHVFSAPPDQPRNPPGPKQPRSSTAPEPARVHGVPLNVSLPELVGVIVPLGVNAAPFGSSSVTVTFTDVA